MKAFTFLPPKGNFLEIDIIIEESLKFHSISKNKIVKSMEGVKIPVVSIQDLIKMKRKAHRDQDVKDIENLLKLKNL